MVEAAFVSSFCSGNFRSAHRVCERCQPVAVSSGCAAEGNWRTHGVGGESDTSSQAATDGERFAGVDRRSVWVDLFLLGRQVVRCSVSPRAPENRESRDEWAGTAVYFHHLHSYGTVFGLAPAFRASKKGVNDFLKEGGRSSGSASRHRARSILVTAEVSLALVLLVCAGLMINTLARVLHTSPGFNPNHLQ
jgi:hypothetical protein